MYYEARTHQLLPVANAMDAAIKIKGGLVANYQVPTWTEGLNPVYIVPDGHINNPMFELAILTNINGELTQVETITNGWIDTTEELEEYFTKALSNNYNMGKAQLIIDKPTGKETANFECGCCGNGFKSNVKYQQNFDQDAGFGICPKCEKYYL